MEPGQGMVPPNDGTEGGMSSRPGDYSAPGLEQAAVPPTPGALQQPAAPGATPQAGQPPSPPIGAPPTNATQPPSAAPVQPQPAQGQPQATPSAQAGATGQPPIPPQPQQGYGGYAPPPGAVPPRRADKGRGSGGKGGWRLWVTAIAAGLIGAILVLVALPAIFGVNPYDMVRGKLKNAAKNEVVEETTKGEPGVSPTQGATDVSAIAKQVTPSVVNIDIRTTPVSTPFSLGQSESGTGSGVIYKADGYIITNNHVVSDAQEITVTLASGTEIKGSKVGADPDTDIAVVKIDKGDLPAISVGNSDNLTVGQLVVAVGSPFGFEQTVTAGIISALHRVVASSNASGQQTSVLTDLIQTDAPINPGNSGGALCDSNAKLIGINAVIASQSGGSEGIGFAIPINTAKQVADDIIAGRPVTHPYLGVLGQTISPSIAERYGLPVSAGAYVTQVVPGSPADKAGIKTGDIIVAIDSKPVKSMDEVVATVRSHAIGDKVSITYYSGTSKKTVDATLAEKPTAVPSQ